MRTRSASMHSEDMLEGLDSVEDLIGDGASSSSVDPPQSVKSLDADGSSSGSGSESGGDDESVARKPTKKVRPVLTMASQSALIMLL
jgi:hypothetical protein